MTAKSLDALNNDQLFHYLECQGVDCTRLRRGRSSMNEQRLREGLYRLHERHAKTSWFRELGIKVKANSDLC
jgi:hypothetical protein